MHLTQGIPEPHYPVHDGTVVATGCGRLCLHRKKIDLSTSLACQAVGVKVVDAGIWLRQLDGLRRPVKTVHKRYTDTSAKSAK